MLACRVSSAYQTGLLVVDLAVRVDDALGLVLRLVCVDPVLRDLRTLDVALEALGADGPAVERLARVCHVILERVPAPVARPVGREAVVTEHVTVLRILLEGALVEVIATAVAYDSHGSRPRRVEIAFVARVLDRSPTRTLLG